VISIFDCYETEGIRDTVSRQGICVSGQGQTAQCSSDRGGGFFVNVGQALFLRGIISTSYEGESAGCNRNKLHALISVEDFIPWINETMNGNNATNDISNEI
jgi:secreted trypsin-like serine protease